MVDVRPAQVSEAETLGQIMWDAIHTGSSAYTAAQKTAWLPNVPSGTGWAKRLGGQRIWMAEKAGAPLGFITLGAEGYIDFAFVRASAQGRGIFRSMLATLEAAARLDGEPRLWTHASLMAQPAFAATGFHVIRRETVERRGETLSRAEMEKSLT